MSRPNAASTLPRRDASMRPTRLRCCASRRYRLRRRDLRANMNVYDYSSIHQLLKQRNVPQVERNEFENILDELKTAEPAKKASIIERGKAWIVRNQELLGAGISLARKALGVGEGS